MCEKLLAAQNFEQVPGKGLMVSGNGVVVSGNEPAWRSSLHPHDVWRVLVLDAAVEAAIRASRFDAALFYGSNNVQGMQ